MMADSIPTALASTSRTVTVVVDTTDQPSTETVQMTLRQPRTERKVQWTNETVDNEHMNKKKSKCCCIYKKPRDFEESSSEDSDEECDHCSGHVEKRTLKLQQLEASAAAMEVMNEVLADIPPKSPHDEPEDPEKSE